MIRQPEPAQSSDRTQAPRTVDVVVVGGGFFGCQVAALARKYADKVVVVEAADRLLTRASYHNQARVHNGYHYPRSILTALRSRVNFPKFCADFGDCVVSDFDKYYAVAREQSKVTASQFATFCQRIGAPLEPAADQVTRWFDPDRIEMVWKTREYAFDSLKLAERMNQLLAEHQVQVQLSTVAKHIEPDADGVRVQLHHALGAVETIRARWLFNCTYSSLNFVLAAAGRPPIPLKHEITEMALVAVPTELHKVGVTVMCGPFFSIMPFPPRGLHSFSHVRYTPRAAWLERDGLPYHTGLPLQVADFKVRSAFVLMQRDAARYLPLLRQLEHVDSLWELKTVLPQSEGNDSRPILFRPDGLWPRLVSVMGGKIDNIYDLPREIADLFADHRRHSDDLAH